MRVEEDNLLKRCCDVADLHLGPVLHLFGVKKGKYKATSERDFILP